MELTVSLDLGTWQSTLDEVPALDLGYTMSALNETCEIDPEYGAVLACWSLPTEETVHQGPDGQVSVNYVPPEWTGAVEEPQVDDGARFLLLRLTVS